MKRNLLLRLLSRIKNTVVFLKTGLYYYDRHIYDYHRLSFSQEGEDTLLFQRLLSGKENGFYVDVGAHHPQRFSNTYRFYLHGWRGINIEPRPGTKKIFDKIRPRDTNVELGIADKHCHLIYYMFEETALNTFDRNIALSHHSQIVATTEIRVCSLADVLSEHIAPNQIIDFLTIDVEGLDLDVLKSNDWLRYRPTYILAEALRMNSVQDFLGTELNLYMTSVGYRLISKLFNTVVFEDSQSKE